MHDVFNDAFVNQVVSFALAIAQEQRGENHLQSPAKLHEKFMKECKELAETDHAWDEIPDVVYYATCLAAQGIYDELHIVSMQLLPALGASIRDAKLACLAKYARRAAGYPKDVEAERETIMAALRTGTVPVFELVIDPATGL